MKKVFFTIACGIVFLAGCCNSSEQNAACGETCSCTAKKDSMELILNIPIKIKPESISAYLRAFEKCQAATLKEEACLDYVIFQSYTDSTEFHLFERWKNKPGHLAHMETAHFNQYREETSGLTDRAKSSMITTYVCPCVNQ